MNLKKLKTLYKQRKFDLDDMDAWEEAIEKAWPDIARVIERAIVLTRRSASLSLEVKQIMGLDELLEALAILEDGE